MARRFSDRLLLTAGPFLAATVIRLLAATMRTEVLGEEYPRELWERGERGIFPFWHDQLLMMVKGYRGPGARILISVSKDGELIARTMEYFGQGAVRGSSHRGGREAFRSLVEISAQPWDIAITPDGPRGPRHQIKDGVVQLARISGRAVIPMAFFASHGHRFASWDRFLFPLPFSRGVYVYGPPLYFHKDEGGEGFRARLQLAMAELEIRGNEHLERYGVSAL
jgi:hypothetical protein